MTGIQRWPDEYQLNVESMRKGRGACIFETDAGAEASEGKPEAA